MFTRAMEPRSAKERTRREAADEINHVMTRFPLIVRMLRETKEAHVPLPGDVELERGCERALTAILGALTRIDPAEGGEATKAEETARDWLACRQVAALLDADQLERMHQVIESVLGANPRHH